MKRIVAFLTFCVWVFAMPAQDFEVSPVLMSFNANPGEIQQQRVHLINHSDKPQKYVFKVQDYELDSLGNKLPVPLGTSKRSCANWLTINPSFVELNPNQAIDLDVMMTVPKDGYSAKWCMIAVQAMEEQSMSEADKSLNTGVKLVPRIVILVKQTPLSNKNYKAKIADLHEVTKPNDLFRSFEATIINMGDNIIDGSVYLTLADLQTAEEERFESQKVTVYPDNVRKVVLQLPKRIDNKKYVLAAILDYGHRQPLEGVQLLLQ